uniref:Uncharacterized LOC100177227 n=1 Tax=Ciona intestinalis TaxID=7719 RepID=F6UU83_CIOIN|nr:uncharacterized protein LOC100177227 [Ciona intestinalis]|eukprot:XP_002121889.1 uncharacterized protein LOC100177227 [Ciona intestinalis]
MEEDILSLQARLSALKSKIRKCNDDLVDIRFMAKRNEDKRYENLLNRPIQQFTTKVSIYQREIDNIKLDMKMRQEEADVNDFLYKCKIAGLKAKIKVFQENLDFFLRERYRREAV